MDRSSGGPVNQALHWNGRKWRLVTTPDPGGTSGSHSHQLLGVSCLSASDCWAVGGSGAGLGGPGLDQALHWGGRKWKSVDVVDPGGKTGTALNVLRGVACVRASDCWAVGTYLDGTSGARLNQTQHWNGKRWRLVTTRSPGQSSGMLSRTLPAVACPSATACRAVGSYPNKAGATLNEALRFNGRKWSVMLTPDPGGKSGMDSNGLDGVGCTAASDCWAVGSFAGGSGGTLNEALRWDGKQWLKVFTPNPGGTGASALNRLAAVTCVSTKDCWAVGTEKRPTAMAASDQMLHWNGRKWRKG
jgi:hypothetical protein